MKAFLKNYRQSPRKVRLVADLIRRRSISRARILLDTAPKRAAIQMKKLLESAVANAKHNDNKTSEENLYIKEIRVDEGPTLKRMRPRARRAAYVIRKRTSRISLTLGEREEKKEKKAPSAKKTAKKPIAKKQATKSSKNLKP